MHVEIKYFNLELNAKGEFSNKNFSLNSSHLNKMNYFCKSIETLRSAKNFKKSHTNFLAVDSFKGRIKGFEIYDIHKKDRMMYSSILFND